MRSENEAKEYIIKRESNNYPIYFFKTDTSGEKEYEEFYTKEENISLSDHDSIGYISTKNFKVSLNKVSSDLNKVFKYNYSNKLSIIKVLKKYVPGFNHRERGKNLDQKM